MLLSSIDNNSTVTMDTATSIYPTNQSDSLGPCHEPRSRQVTFSPEELTELFSCTRYSFIMYTIITGSLCVFGLIGNIVSFVVFYVDRLKTSTSFLLQSLSVIDALMLVGSFTFFAIPNLEQYTGWIQGYSINVYPVLQVYFFPLLVIVQTATIWMTVLVGVNRYIAVCMPYQAIRLCTVQQAKRQLAVVLLFSFLYNAPKFAEGQLMYDPDREMHCAVHTPFGNDWYYRFIYNNALYVLFIFVMPLLILSVLNVKLVNALKDVKRKRREMQSARQQQDNNITLVLIVVIVVFSICQFPALVTQIFWSVLDDSARDCGGFQFYFSQISNTLVTANSAVNFLIYLAFNQRFRLVLTHLLRGERYPPTNKKPRFGAKTTTGQPNEGNGTKLEDGIKFAGDFRTGGGNTCITKVSPVKSIDTNNTVEGLGGCESECVVLLDGSNSKDGESLDSKDIITNSSSVQQSDVICTSV